MRFLDIIRKKRDGEKLNEKELEFFIKSINSNEVPDYQISALLMAIFFKGMDFTETAILTKYMIESGIKADLSFLNVPTADKHSTGGVGDKISIVLAPLVASCNVAVGMMSGRALGHTGGTLDKLEAIPGFNVNLNLDEYYSLLKKSNVAMIGQTKEIAIADKYLYAMRDATATVESIPLITSSIMSKKIAEGTKNLVIDLKVGKGAFIKNIEDGETLGKYMIEVGKQNGVNTRCILTDMNNPLGYQIGNALEIIECIDILKGDYKAYDAYELILILSAHMVSMAKNISLIEAEKMVKNSLKSGKALDKFKEMVKNQGGNPSIIDDYSLFGKAKFSKTATLEDIIKLNPEIYNNTKNNHSNVDKNIIQNKSNLEEEFYIEEIDAFQFGLASTIAGAGRSKKEDKVSAQAGITLHKKHGDKINFSEKLFTIYADEKEKLDAGFELACKSYKFSNKAVKRKNLIIKILE